MKYNQFIEKLNEASLNIHKDGFNFYTGYESIPNTKWFLQKKEEIGGVSGGSCWDDSAPRPYSRTPDVENLNFDKEILSILEVLPEANSLNFISGAKLVRRINDKVKKDEKTDYEYYGNRTDYIILTLKLYDIYEILSEQFKWEE